jgi:hypothetical protein
VLDVDTPNQRKPFQNLGGAGGGERVLVVHARKGGADDNMGDIARAEFVQGRIDDRPGNPVVGL